MEGKELKRRVSMNRPGTGTQRITVLTVDVEDGASPVRSAGDSLASGSQMWKGPVGKWFFVCLFFDEEK